MNSTRPNNAEALIAVLREVIDFLEGSEPSDWTAWTPREVVVDLQREISNLQNTGEPEDAKMLHMHFLPTASIQEIAMTNGWHGSYSRLATQVDKWIAKFI